VALAPGLHLIDRIMTQTLQTTTESASPAEYARCNEIVDRAVRGTTFIAETNPGGFRHAWEIEPSQFFVPKYTSGDDV